MKYILNKKEAALIDEISINDYKIPSIVLMENAGKKTSEYIINNISSVKNILIIAGSGNNGGDAFVCARHLNNQNYNLTVLLIKDKKDIKNDALINLNILENLNIEIKNLSDDLDFNSYDLIIDGILGIGLDREVKDLYKDLINKVNKVNIKKLAIDLPSGLNSSNGVVLGSALKCDYSITYGYLKLAHLINKNFCGKTIIFDIGFPKEIIKKYKFNPSKLFELEDAKKILPRLKIDAHKYQNGNLLLIGGSKSKAGSIIMSAKAAMKTGLGLATLLVPEEIILYSNAHLLEAMIDSYESYNDIEINLNKKSAIAIGPGLKINNESIKIIKNLIDKNIPMVLDADALNCISKNIDNKKDFFRNNENIIITPHIKEFSRLINKSIKEINNDRVNILKYYSKEWNITIVLKGACTFIASNKGDIYINSSSNEALASAGTGDVLTGIISAFLAQKISTLNSALLGVFIHGLSGDIASLKLGKRASIASDVINNIFEAIKEIEE